MKYSENKEVFKQTLLRINEPVLDYPFFAGDLLNALEKKGKISVIPHSPYGDAFTSRVNDAEYNLNTGMMVLYFEDEKKFTFSISKQDINQPSPKKYYVNDTKINQELNFRFTD